MAIQIDEKLLSAEVKTVLSNAKNKSQLLRDALEFYVKNMKGENISEKKTNYEDELINDVRDIKTMLLQMSQVNQVITKENPIVIEKRAVVEDVEPIKKGEEVKNNIKFKDIESNDIKKKSKEVITKKVGNVNDNEMSDEEKEEIEKMVNDSLNFFDFDQGK
ncbi:hypothetical protein FDB61_17915 [Clostridium botulinum]|nr:hypothetical protein [Clostridium botulinum]